MSKKPNSVADQLKAITSPDDPRASVKRKGAGFIVSFNSSGRLVFRYNNSVIQRRLDSLLNTWLETIVSRGRYENRISSDVTREAFQEWIQLPELNRAELERRSRQYAVRTDQVPQDKEIQEATLDVERKRDTHAFAMQLIADAKRDTGMTSYERYLSAKNEQRGE
jgi:Arc/MetJ-type ribon-helix-helix transcriptional regulator